MVKPAMAMPAMAQCKVRLDFILVNLEFKTIAALYSLFLAGRQRGLATRNPALFRRTSGAVA